MSRRLTALALGLLALAVAPVVAGASHSGGKNPKQDFATGTGHRFASGPPSLPAGVESRTIMHVNARSVPDGERARGRFFVKRKASALVTSRPDFDFSGG